MLENLLVNLEHYLPMLAGKLVAFLVICFIWPKLTKFLVKSFEKAMSLRNNDPLLISFLKSLIKTIMYIILAFILVGILGVRATSLVTILGTAGVAVGLALQGSLSNLASGILILFFKQVSKGDFVSSLDKNIEGTVQSIHILYTIIQQPNGPVIIVPNSQIANASIINYSKNPFRRLDLVYSASYDDPVNKVISVLHQVIENEPRIIKNNPSMPITISLTKQNASSLDYMFRAWVRKEDYVDTMLDCNINVKKFFDKNGIEIPYNKLDLYMKNNLDIDNKQ
ncbi:mechanosensitive ion channel family protein [Fusobacterium nucleatum subsp. nucleatum ATCC 25586]|uniref:Mechanosensitive ion channel family protein n=2 Tax=Fusobacterium nucleatum TaxID=851 RepID=Q8RFR8_FUSNN|nr:Small-conductance mechanosensitive channel [Fusobacterium nucleatum subsp. nucleatum ATCC 25586]AVQ15939.1 mechanosensitive ion channel family protein [Fusobacterium nucleatum subsp. nucleatum ATCC 25586]